MKSNIDATSQAPAWPAPRYLVRGALHRMAWRETGHLAGAPWLLLHGGPGGGCRPGMLQPFDLARQRVIAPDQRGAGASRPRGALQGNSTAALVADLEALRLHLGVQRWSLLAGSWGTVVALMYAERYPQHVHRLILRGAFRVTRREVGGLLLPSARKRAPLNGGTAWPVRAGTPLPAALACLAQLLQSATGGVASLSVVRGWALREMSDAAAGLRRTLLHAQGIEAAPVRREWAALRKQQRRAKARLHQPGISKADHSSWAKYRVQAHYLRHHGFARPIELDGAVRAIALHGISVDWVHGRFDTICPPANSLGWARMGRAAGGPAEVHLPPCGHLAGEPAMRKILRRRVNAP